MTRVELAATAVEDLNAMIVTHSLPANTRQRVKRSLRSLEVAPRIGPELGGPWAGFRSSSALWRWMILVHLLIEEEDRAVVIIVRDARSSSAATNPRR